MSSDMLRNSPLCVNSRFKIRVRPCYPWLKIPCPIRVCISWLAMDIIELFEEIRRRPGIYIDGDKSLKRVRSFLVGYQVGAATTARELTDREHFHRFDEWVASRLGYTGSSRGWCDMILGRAGSDEK